MTRYNILSKYGLLSFYQIFLVFIFLIIPTFSYAEGMTSPYYYAWSNNIGWINFENVTVTDSALSGYVWSQNSGWINLSPTQGGVSNDAGILSGYAWGESLGWINFTGVSIDTSTGKFSGRATGSLIGTLTFDCTNCDVRTDWRPANNAEPSAGVGGGGIVSNTGVGIGVNYIWQTGEWGACTGGVQKRDVFCVDKLGDGTVYTDKTCRTQKPISVQNCALEQEQEQKLNLITEREVDNQVRVISENNKEVKDNQNNQNNRDGKEACEPFNTDLEPGDRGDAVKRLQIFLNNQELGVTERGEETNLYGARTELAVEAFQEKYADEILIPLNLTKGTGVFGPSTRKKVNNMQLCVYNNTKMVSDRAEDAQISTTPEKQVKKQEEKPIPKIESFWVRLWRLIISIFR